jgi:hypothetical protein
VREPCSASGATSPASLRPSAHKRPPGLGRSGWGGRVGRSGRFLIGVALTRPCFDATRSVGEVSGRDHTLLGVVLIPIPPGPDEALRIHAALQVHRRLAGTIRTT